MRRVYEDGRHHVSIFDRRLSKFIRFLRRYIVCFFLHVVEGNGLTVLASFEVEGEAVHVDRTARNDGLCSLDGNVEGQVVNVLQCLFRYTRIAMGY